MQSTIYRNIWTTLTLIYFVKVYRSERRLYWKINRLCLITFTGSFLMDDLDIINTKIK